MLRMMSGKTRRDRIGNVTIKERVGVAPMVEKLVENRLRWFGHVERRPIDAVVRRVYQLEESHIKRGRGRPRKTIRKTIRKDLEVNELNSNMIYDKKTIWRNLILAVELTWWNKTLLLLLYKKLIFLWMDQSALIKKY